MRVLIVEDKDSLRAMLRRALEQAGHTVGEAATGASALLKLRQEQCDLLLTDLKLPDISGLDLLRSLERSGRDLPTIVMTAYGSVESAVEAMKLGAYDFIQKPIDLDHLLLLISRALEHKRLLTENLLLKEELAARVGSPTIIGEHPAMKEAADKVLTVAPTNATVLLLGESGTGKELFAKAIHDLSPRRNFPFVTVNCAAIPEELVENELFGHERGAYTGASERRAGKFELANHGTIFLDEIGEMPLSAQGKLLRAIEEQRIERLGSELSIELDVRIIAATNKDLAAAVARKEFREDLYFRLFVFPITIPPLRERRSDIPLLANFFLKRIAAELKRKKLSFSPAALARLEQHHWPGNARELRNVVERAAILCRESEIGPEALELPDASGPVAELPAIEPLNGFDLAGTLPEARERAVRAIEIYKIKAALRQARGNRLRAAELLGISYRALLDKLKQYQL